MTKDKKKKPSIDAVFVTMATPSGSVEKSDTEKKSRKKQVSWSHLKPPTVPIEFMERMDEKARKPIARKKKEDKPIRRRYLELDQYSHYFFIQDSPAPDKFLEQLADDLVEWARKEDSLKMIHFFDEVGVPDTSYHGWRKRCPKLQAAHDWALRLLGARREIGAMTGKYKEKIILHSLHQYDPEAKAADEWHFSKMKEGAAPEYYDVFVNPIRVGSKEDDEESKKEEKVTSKS